MLKLPIVLFVEDTVFMFITKSQQTKYNESSEVILKLPFYFIYFFILQSLYAFNTCVWSEEPFILNTIKAFNRL